MSRRDSARMAGCGADILRAGEAAVVVEARGVDRHIQHVEDLAGMPGPAAGSSTIPPVPMRATPPRCTTYQTPRHEIMDAIPNERTCPSTSYTSRELGSS